LRIKEQERRLTLHEHDDDDDDDDGSGNLCILIPKVVNLAIKRLSHFTRCNDTKAPVIQIFRRLKPDMISGAWLQVWCFVGISPNMMCGCVLRLFSLFYIYRVSELFFVVVSYVLIKYLHFA
jgi:hypothetical protein